MQQKKFMDTRKKGKVPNRGVIEYEIPQPRRKAEEEAKRAEQQRQYEAAQIQARAQIEEPQRAEYNRLVQQKMQEQEAARKKADADKKMEAEKGSRAEQIAIAKAAIEANQCPYAGGTTVACAKSDGIATCVKKLCDNIGVVDGKTFCDDPTIQDIMQIDLFEKFGLTSSEWSDLATAMEKCRSPEKITIMKNFISSLYAYLQKMRGESGPESASTTKIISLQKLIESLIELVESEEKHACAGDKCGEPDDSDTFLTFDELAGATEEKELINRGFLYPVRYPGLFPNFSKGILLFGVPGTGKTMIAQATARAISDAAFYAPTPADLKGGVVGETEKKIKNVFECACERITKDPKYKQAILFFDEFESVAAKRGGSGAGVSSSALTVPTLLQYLEGTAAKRVEKPGKIFIIAATNLPWCLDDAIIRRFPIQVMVDLPDRNAREFIIRDKLNRAFSKFILEKDFGTYGIVKDDQTKKNTTSNTNGMWKNKAYTVDNFPITLNDDGSINKDSGGIYKQMLNIFLSKRTNVDQIVDFIVQLTGPNNTEEAKQYRRFISNVELEHSDLATSLFGFSASDVAKAMDKIISETGFSTLRNKSRLSVYNLNNLNIPQHVKTNYLVMAESFQGGSPVKVSGGDNSKLTTWNINVEEQIGFVEGKQGGYVTYSTPANVKGGPTNPIGVGTVNENQYKMVVEYNRTRQPPENAMC
jgi:SpoVK/Ycf46/Vps4 family AAA+-type ATPase